MVLPYVGQANENDIISNILCFSQFREFYNKEYIPRKDKIKLNWWIHPELYDFGYFAMSAVNKETGKDEIWLQWGPVTPVDAYLVAHELSHIIRKVDNLSLQIFEKDLNYVNVAGFIKSVLEDRFVDGMLKNEYGFELIDHYNEVISSAEKSLRETKIGALSDITHIELVLVNADFFLRSSLIEGDTIFTQKLNKYQKNLGRKFKSVAKESEELASEALRIGFGPLDKQRQIFEYIINKYKLAKALSISEIP